MSIKKQEKLRIQHVLASIWGLGLDLKFQREKIECSWKRRKSLYEVSLQRNLNLPHMMKIQKLDLQILCYTSSITRVMSDVFSGTEKSSGKEDCHQR